MKPEKLKRSGTTEGEDRPESFKLQESSVSWKKIRETKSEIEDDLGESYREERIRAIVRGDRREQLRLTASLATLLYHQVKDDRELYEEEFEMIRPLYLNIERRLLLPDWREYLRTFCQLYNEPINMSIMVELDKRNGDKLEALIFEEERRNRLLLLEYSKLGDDALEDMDDLSFTLSNEDVGDFVKSIGACLVVYLKAYGGQLVTWVFQGETGELLETMKRETPPDVQSLINEKAFAKDDSLGERNRESARRAFDKLGEIIVDPIGKYLERVGKPNTEGSRRVYFMPCPTLSPIFTAVEVHNHRSMREFSVAQGKSLISTVHEQASSRAEMEKQGKGVRDKVDPQNGIGGRDKRTGDSDSRSRGIA